MKFKCHETFTQELEAMRLEGMHTWLWAISLHRDISLLAQRYWIRLVLSLSRWQLTYIAASVPST